MAIKILGKLETSAMDGVLADSKQISGSYMTVTSVERNNLSDNLKTDGMLVYDTTDKKEYRWDNSKKEWKIERALEYGEGLPLMDGSGSLGSSDAVSRADHQHPSDSSKFDKKGGTITGAVTVEGLISANGGLQVGTPSVTTDAANKGYVDNTFVSKPTTTTTKILTINSNGTSGTLDYSSSPLSDSVPIADSNGNIKTNTPTEGSDCANKAYVDYIFDGSLKAISYDNYLLMIEAFNTFGPNAYKVGQNIMIVTLNVPDLWVSLVEEGELAKTDYIYSSDAAFTNLLNSLGKVKVGHYTLSPLETLKVDLTNYVTLDTPLTINASKSFVSDNGNAKISFASDTTNLGIYSSLSASELKMTNITEGATEYTGYTATQIHRDAPNNKGNSTTNYFKFPVNEVDLNLTVATLEDIDPILEGRVTAVTFNITEADTEINFNNGLPGMTLVNWGDGTIDNLTTHTYKLAGEYVCKIYDLTEISFSNELAPEINLFNSISKCVIGDYVTTINDGAFKNCTNLTNVVIGDRVTSIGESAFRYCSSLNSVIIGSSVRTIGGSAFWGCNSLTNIGLPDVVTSIGQNAFYNCSGLTSMIIPNRVTLIGSSAFYGCSGLTIVEIGDGVKIIGDNAFTGCSGLTNVVIPDLVISIGKEAFFGCDALTSVKIPDSVTSIGSDAFKECSITKAVLPTHAISHIPKGNLQEVVITSGDEIYDNAFDGCENLNNVVIGDGVTSIGISAFEECNSLKSVKIPDSVNTIGKDAFYSCSGLTNLVIGDGVTTIGEHAFSWCSNLTSLVIGNSVTSIGQSAFSNCSSLTSVVIPDSVTDIGGGIFYDCYNLTSVVIPGSIETLKSEMFGYCSKLTNITICDGVKNIENIALDSSLSTVVIPLSVESMFSFAFPQEATIIFKGINPIPYQYTFTNQHAIYVPKGTLNKYIEEWSKGLGFDQSIIDKMYESDDDREAYLSDIKNNVENGVGKDSILQLPDNSADGFLFAEYNDDGTVKKYKNEYAVEQYQELKDIVDAGDKVPYGARGNYSSSFGGKSSAWGKRSHAQGTCTIAIGNYSHAEGDNSVTIGPDSHAEGYSTTAKGSGSHAEGSNTIALGAYSHAEGANTIAELDASHAEGYGSIAEGMYSHAEGSGTVAVNSYTHAEGEGSEASGIASHAEGIGTFAKGDGSHSEGASTFAIGEHSHAEGYGSVAQITAISGHAEGSNTYAIGAASHSEGSNTLATGDHSHSGGINSNAIGWSSFAHGNGVIALGTALMAVGSFNNNDADAVFEVGNGLAEDERDKSGNIIKQNRSNAFKVMLDGRAKVYGSPTDREDVLRRQDILDIIYPVNSVYLTFDSTFDPNVRFGGTWSILPDGYLKADLNPSLTTSGSYKILSSNLPTHTHTMSHDHLIDTKISTNEVSLETEAALLGDHYAESDGSEHTHNLLVDTGTEVTGRSIRLTDFDTTEQSLYSSSYVQESGSHVHLLSNLKHTHLIKVPSQEVEINVKTAGCSASTGNGNFSNNDFKPKYYSVKVWVRTN